MIEVFKITHNYYDSDVAVELPLNTRASTRVHKFKFENYSFHYDLRKYSVCPCTYCEYMEQSADYVVDTDNLDKFKPRIDMLPKLQSLEF